MAASSKLQRWTDLLAALLRRHSAVEFEILRRDVPAYADPQRSRDAVLRMFERDKDELRALGVPIETATDADGNLSRYRLATRNFYLPFLQLAYDARRPPRRPAGPGYQSLPVLAFEPEELDAVARAAHRVAALGDPLLAAEAMRALRKLGHDLPVPARDTGELVALDHLPSAELLETLNAALRRQKRVTFAYRSMHRDREESREVEPYGLAFLSGHWYLIARDCTAEAVRQFRVQRIRDARINTQRAQTADFTVPAEFDLAVYARSQQAWELGDAELEEVTVRFTVANGHTMPALRLGEPVGDDPSRRRFRVRRPETFALWILGFAGDAVIEAPDTMRERLAALARETLAACEDTP